MASVLFGISSAELEASKKKERRRCSVGGWTGYKKQVCGFIMTSSNNTHSNIKYRLHLKVCEICRDNPVKDNFKVAGSMSTPKVSFE